MKAIGIRVQSKQIYYSIVEETDTDYYITAVEKFTVPMALLMPDRLSYIRTSFQSIIKEFGVSNAGIRIAEISQTVNNGIIERTYIEGVLQELLSNCSVNNYFSGRKNTIARLLEMNQKEVSSIMDANKCLFEFDKWNDYSKEERESIVAGFASIRLGGEDE